MVWILAIYTIVNYALWIFLAIVQIYPGWLEKHNYGTEQDKDIRMRTYDSGFWHFTEILQDYICFGIDVIIQGIVILLQVILFIILIRTMKHKLHFYYMNLKVRLYILFILSFIVLVFHIAYYSSFSHMYLDDFPISKHRFELCGWILYNLLMLIPLTLYAVYIVDSIDFKEYIYKIMIGFGISNYYNLSSLFIYIRHDPNNNDPEDSETTESMFKQISFDRDSINHDELLSYRDDSI